MYIFKKKESKKGLQKENELCAIYRNANCIKSVANSNWIIRSPQLRLHFFHFFFKYISFMQFNASSLIFFLPPFNRYFHKREHTLALAVNIIMESRYCFHTCPIQSWNMHVMSRSNYIIVLDVMYNFNCILHRGGFCWVKFHLYQVRFNSFYFTLFFFFPFFFDENDERSVVLFLIIGLWEINDMKSFTVKDIS